MDRVPLIIMAGFQRRGSAWGFHSFCFCFIIFSYNVLMS